MSKLDPVPADLVRAAGGLVWRRKRGDVQLLVVHRPKYDDWTFPKGKLDPGETHEQAALREVEEETGLRCRLGPELQSVSYRDAKRRPKTVRYWAMTVVDGRFRPNAEVDELRWLGPAEVGPALSYRHDLDVLASFVDTSPSFTEK